MAGQPSSYALVKNIQASSADKTVLDQTGWAQVTCKLDSQAPGSYHRIEVGSGSQGIELEPGDIATFVIAPGTRMRVATDAAADVKFTFVITPLPIDDFLQMFADLRAVLQALACR